MPEKSSKYVSSGCIGYHRNFKEVFDYYGLNAEGIANKAKNTEIGDRREDMAESYIISIDQSTQGTKRCFLIRTACCFRERSPYKQIINEKDGFLMIRKKFTRIPYRW